MVEIIAFDLNGVLLRSGHLVSEVLMSFVGKPYHFIKKQYLKYSLGKISRDEFWKSVGMKPSEGEKLLSEKVIPIVGTSFFEKLSKSCKLAILSNMPKEWTDLLFFSRIPPSLFNLNMLSYPETLE